MGLDMFMQGHEYHSDNRKTLDDFPVKEIIVELGYWRKHPDLHGAIVQTFADGTDDCEPIELSEDDVNKIIEMIKSGDLPATSGFFFGQSIRPTEDKEAYEQQAKRDIELFENALKWLRSETKDGFRWVTYRASW